jgi:hypothetical protein
VIQFTYGEISWGSDFRKPRELRPSTENTLVGGGGSAHSFHIDGNRIADIAPILRANLSREAKLMTDEHSSYKEVGAEFVSHDTVIHSQDEHVHYWNEVTASLAARKSQYIQCFRPIKKVAASPWGRAGRARSGLGRGGVGM